MGKRDFLRRHLLDAPPGTASAADLGQNPQCTTPSGWWWWSSSWWWWYEFSEVHKEGRRTTGHSAET